MKIKYGTTRTVILIGKYAFKFPTIVEWRLFLYGLLGNMQERKFWQQQPESQHMMCPVLSAIPGGFVTVMRRATPVSVGEWDTKEKEWFDRAVILNIPVENKPDSWGVLEGRVVAIDYGSDYRSGYESAA